MPNPIPTDAHVIIIGAMKCGTTSLYDYMTAHPALCPAKSKEPEFFSEHQGHGLHVKDYADVWEFDPTRHRYAVEASTGYTKYPAEPNVARKMAEYGIHPRLIYIMRNPLDRIASHYYFMAQRDPAWVLNITDSHLISSSSYYMQLSQYRRYFSAERFLLLDFDDLRLSPKCVLDKVYDFLGLAERHYPTTFNAKNVTPSESLAEKRFKKLGLRRVYGLAPKPVRELSKQLLRSCSTPVRRELSESERMQVHDLLRDDMRSLCEEYGVDVAPWGFEV